MEGTPRLQSEYHLLVGCSDYRKSRFFWGEGGGEGAGNNDTTIIVVSRIRDTFQSTNKQGKNIKCF